jgi:phosphoacetylglucosamine mutase
MSSLATFSEGLKAILRHGKPSKYMGYGTSGFRAHADALEGIVARMGVLAALRSKYTKEIVGIQITASHNPVEDNGVKLVDPDGGMMEQSWEEYAAIIGNASDDVRFCSSHRGFLTDRSCFLV